MRFLIKRNQLVLQGNLTMEEKPYIDKCMISIDKNGDWFHENKPIIHEPFKLLFVKNLHRDKWGRYLIHWRGQTCEVDVEDVPFVIQRVEPSHNGDKIQSVSIILNDHSSETLDLSSLSVGKENVLYCAVKGGVFEARFSRPAYYQFADLLDYNEEVNEYYLVVNGKKTPLPGLS